MLSKKLWKKKKPFNCVTVSGGDPYFAPLPQKTLILSKDREKTLVRCRHKIVDKIEFCERIAEKSANFARGLREKLIINTRSPPPLLPALSNFSKCLL